MTKQNREELAYESIIKLILESQFKPGDFLLETDLSQKLQLSRTPVRHALAKLVAEGFLDKKKKKDVLSHQLPPRMQNMFFMQEKE